jgi:hypothetical protein
MRRKKSFRRISKMFEKKGVVIRIVVPDLDYIIQKDKMQDCELPHQKSTPNYFNYNLISSIFKEKDYLF